MEKVRTRSANETKALAKKHSTEMKKIQDYDKSKTMLFNKEIANLKNKIVELKQQHDVYCHDNTQQKTQMQQELHDEIHGTVVEPLQSRKEQRVHMTHKCLSECWFLRVASVLVVLANP